MKNNKSEIEIEKEIEDLLKDKDLTYCKKSSWWINILKKAIKQSFEKGKASKQKDVLKLLESIENKLKLTKSKWLKLSKEHCKKYNAPEGFVDKREHICGEKLCAIEGERMALQELEDEIKLRIEQKW